MRVRQSLMQHKKAQLGMQFNWIFVLVIGAVILGFFITVIKNQERRSTAEQATDLVETIDTLFVTISSNPNTVETFSIRNAELEFLCEEGQSRYYIQGAGPVETTYKPLFSAETLRGSSITTWTKAWNAPFEAGTLTYIADDLTLFLFIPELGVTNGNIAKLYNELPTSFNKEIVTPDVVSAYKPTGYSRYVIITTEDVIDDGLVLPTMIKEPHYRIIPGEQAADLDDVFDLDFDSEGSTSVFTKDLLWAAIFSHDAAYYECNTEKAIKKLTHLSNVLHDRTDALVDVYTDSRCFYFLNDARTPLNNLASITVTDPFHTQLNTINTQKEELEIIQGLIQRGPLCPYIY